MAPESKTFDDNTATGALTEADPEDFMIVRRLPNAVEIDGVVRSLRSCLPPSNALAASLR